MHSPSSDSSGRHLRTVRLDDGIVEIQLDRDDGAVNTLDDAFLLQLAEVVDALESDAHVRGVYLCSTKDAFLAGADIQALWSLLHESAENQTAFFKKMHRIFVRLESLPVPTICAINGYALGGGLEAALCTDYRILASDAKIGFPEVGFGILPGAGGTVRTPRLAGAATALEWLSGGRSYAAAVALRAGMVDAVATPENLRDTALEWLRNAIVGQHDWRARRSQRQSGFTLDDDALKDARTRAQQRARHYPAALAIVGLLERGAGLTRDAAIDAEIETFATLAQTATAKAMVGIFIADQQLRKQSRALARAAKPLRKAAVLGAGIMGGGIAYTTALKGLPVVMKDIAQRSLDLGMGEARKLLDKQVEAGRLPAPTAESILASISPTLEFSGFETVDIVVEAVVENLKVKQDVLREVESRTSADTVLASNTSSLAIGDIALPLQRPQNVVGMHFFNPVHMMPLVEVIRGPQSSDAAIATTVAYALAMGKVPLVVKDCAGFLVNRLLGAYFTAFLQLIRDGADFVQIDRAMESWGWPMGPAYLIDVAGIDTLDKAMKILGQAYPDVMGSDFETAIQCLCKAGRYGQKNGAGFYRYENDARGKPRRSPDPAADALLMQVRSNGTHAFSDTEIVDRMMFAMMLEADRCLESAVVGSAIELDAGMRLGTGFPAHEVGPLWAADRMGLDALLQRCSQYAALGGLFTPGAGLQRRAAQRQAYYPQAAR